MEKENITPFPRSIEFWENDVFNYDRYEEAIEIWEEENNFPESGEKND